MEQRTIICKVNNQYYVFDAIKKETSGETDIYHRLNNGYTAARIKENKIKLLKNKNRKTVTHVNGDKIKFLENENIDKGKVVRIEDYKPHKVRVYGYENYSTKTSVNIEGIQNTDINSNIKFPKYTTKANIVINNTIIKFNGRNKWKSEIINNGHKDMITKVNNSEYIICLKDNIYRIQLRQNKI